jgi:hypothetical protein
MSIKNTDRISIHAASSKIEMIKEKAKDSQKTVNDFIISSCLNQPQKSQEQDPNSEELIKVLVKIFIDAGINADIPTKFHKKINEIAEAVMNE